SGRARGRSRGLATSLAESRRDERGGAMMAEERRVVREGAPNWWILLVSGIAWLLIAWIVLRLDVTSVATVGVLIGAVFIVAAVNEVTVASLVSGGWKIWHYVMAFIFFLGGLWGLITPIDTFFCS